MLPHMKLYLFLMQLGIVILSKKKDPDYLPPRKHTKRTKPVEVDDDSEPRPKRKYVRKLKPELPLKSSGSDGAFKKPNHETSNNTKSYVTKNQRDEEIDAIANLTSYKDESFLPTYQSYFLQLNSQLTQSPVSPKIDIQDAVGFDKNRIKMLEKDLANECKALFDNKASKEQEICLQASLNEVVPQSIVDYYPTTLEKFQYKETTNESLSSRKNNKYISNIIKDAEKNPEIPNSYGLPMLSIFEEENELSVNDTFKMNEKINSPNCAINEKNDVTFISKTPVQFAFTKSTQKIESLQKISTEELPLQTTPTNSKQNNLKPNLINFKGAKILDGSSQNIHQSLKNLPLGNDFSSTNLISQHSSKDNIIFFNIGSQSIPIIISDKSNSQLRPSSSTQESIKPILRDENTDVEESSSSSKMFSSSSSDHENQDQFHFLDILDKNSNNDANIDSISFDSMNQVPQCSSPFSIHEEDCLHDSNFPNEKEIESGFRDSSDKRVHMKSVLKMIPSSINQFNHHDLDNYPIWNCLTKEFERFLGLIFNTITKIEQSQLPILTQKTNSNIWLTFRKSVEYDFEKKLNLGLYECLNVIKVVNNIENTFFTRFEKIYLFLMKKSFPDTFFYPGDIKHSDASNEIYKFFCTFIYNVKIRKYFYPGSAEFNSIDDISYEVNDFSKKLEGLINRFNIIYKNFMLQMRVIYMSDIENYSKYFGLNFLPNSEFCTEKIIKYWTVTFFNDETNLILLTLFPDLKYFIEFLVETPTIDIATFKMFHLFFSLIAFKYHFLRENIKSRTEECIKKAEMITQSNFFNMFMMDMRFTIALASINLLDNSQISSMLFFKAFLSYVRIEDATFLNFFFIDEFYIFDECIIEKIFHGTKVKPCKEDLPIQIININSCKYLQLEGLTPNLVSEAIGFLKINRSGIIAKTLHKENCRIFQNISNYDNENFYRTRTIELNELGKYLLAYLSNY
ncbi:hypothetical protein TUBRATIS_29400 [Tubulinosema ratisbonensis]|uniref:Uncharacterized protein n=1 Tax=Tubulinosema ratisbonensis TaxID=291195 RepID=A0A437AHW8_9MICR|nr:hypothetical protein TUBRATIS_29400 [Tubulinosema ratisbonensis]